MKLVRVGYKALVRPYPEYWALFLVICTQERWTETEIYPEPLKKDNQGNEKPLFRGDEKIWWF